MRRIPSNLFLLFFAALAGVASSACQSGGVGDPCIAEDEYNRLFSGYAATEVNVESRSFQCETRVCLIANFEGRVSCPYGQAGDLPAMPNSVSPTLPEADRCYIPGTKISPNTSINVPVLPQRKQRPADKTVYCSCRCDGPDTNVNYCECPSGYSCEKLVTDYGFGSAQLAGSYCLKDGTKLVDPSNLGPTCTLGTHDCGKSQQPYGI